VLLALVVRLGLLAFASRDEARLLSPPDSQEYVAIARNVAAGHGFSAAATAPFTPDIRRTPVYPAVLAPALVWSGAGLRLAALTNVVAGTLTVLATFAIACRLFGPAAALAAALVLALDVSSVSFSVVILTETLFAALVALAVWVLVRPAGQDETATPIGAGVVLGAAALCRPIGVALGPAMLPLCAWTGGGRRQILRRYLMLNVAFAAVVALWVLRNWAVAGVPTISSIAAVNLYFHRAVTVQARLEGRDPDDVRHEWEREFAGRSDVANEEARAAWLAAAGRRIIVANLGIYLRAAVDGLGRMARPDSDEGPRLLDAAPGTPAGARLLRIGWAQLLAVYALAVVGLTASVAGRGVRRAALVVATPLLYFAAMAGPEAYPRFRVPMMPYVAMLAGAGWRAMRTGLTRA